MHSFKSIHFKLSHGFTLIELMITIAIIALIAAIAIPNFIAYRNKAFCSQTENDASGVVAAIADYFGNASCTHTPHIADLKITLENPVDIVGVDPNKNITIMVTDQSKRCPSDYQNANIMWNNSVFTRTIN